MKPDLRLEFPITAELSELAQHALANAEWQRRIYTGGEWGPEEKPVQPALLLVKDGGAYLMSPFVAKDAPDSARLLKPDGLPKVVYALGCKPEDGHIGGDDFGEDLEGLPVMIMRCIARRGHAGFVVIELSPTQVQFAVRYKVV